MELIDELRRIAARMREALTDRDYVRFDATSAAAIESAAAALASRPPSEPAPLPPLPEPGGETNGDVFGHESEPLFTVAQMEEYARSAIAASGNPATARSDDENGCLACVTCGQPVEVQRGAQEQQDAARYRWLKMTASPGEQMEMLRTPWPKWDDAIDAALTQSRRET